MDVSDEGMASLISAVAERSADRAAEKAVAQTFSSLGVDLDNRDHVASLREAFTGYHTDYLNKQMKTTAWYSGKVQGIFLILSGIVGALVSFMAQAVSNTHFRQ